MEKVKTTQGNLASKKIVTSSADHSFGQFQELLGRGFDVLGRQRRRAEAVFWARRAQTWTLRFRSMVGESIDS